ncbi:hypothetical protein J6590_007747 [Homalodisca vitripennis]|nr:hypothetical protein J6590_007747 [Homalodisca vitripennis]
MPERINDQNQNQNLMEDNVEGKIEVKVTQADQLTKRLLMSCLEFINNADGSTMFGDTLNSVKTPVERSQGKSDEFED